MSDKARDNADFAGLMQGFLKSRGFYFGASDKWAGAVTQSAMDKFLESVGYDLIEEIISEPVYHRQQIQSLGTVRIYRDSSSVVSFTAGMTVDADGSPFAYHPLNTGLDFTANAGYPGSWWGIATNASGQPYIQGSSDPAPGYYVSTTALQYPPFSASNPRRYVNSSEVPFIVIPGGVSWGKLGQKCLVSYQGKTQAAIVADIGPKNHVGEGSIALARALGINSSPKTGGVDSGVFYELFP